MAYHIGIDDESAYDDYYFNFSGNSIYRATCDEGTQTTISGTTSGIVNRIIFFATTGTVNGDVKGVLYRSSDGQYKGQTARGHYIYDYPPTGVTKYITRLESDDSPNNFVAYQIYDAKTNFNRNGNWFGLFCEEGAEIIIASGTEYNVGIMTYIGGPYLGVEYTGGVKDGGYKFVESYGGGGYSHPENYTVTKSSLSKDQRPGGQEWAFMVYARYKSNQMRYRGNTDGSRINLQHKCCAFGGVPFGCAAKVEGIEI